MSDSPWYQKVKWSRGVNMPDLSTHSVSCSIESWHPLIPKVVGFEEAYVTLGNSIGCLSCVI